MSSPTLLSPGVPTLPATTARCSSLRFTCVHVAFQSSTLPAVLELLEQRGPGPSLLFSSLAPWEGGVLLELCLVPLEPLGRWYLLLSGFLQLLTCLPFAKSDKYFQSVFLDLALVERKPLCPSHIIDVEHQGPLWADDKLLGDTLQHC